MMISKFVSGFGFEIDQASVKRVDKTLNHIEGRLKKLGALNRPIKLNLEGFKVDQSKLNIALGNALDIASTRVVFEVSRFVVNQGALNRDVHNALTRASASQTMHVNQHQAAGGVRGSHVAGAVGGGLIGRGISSFYGPALALGLGGYGLSTLNKRNQEIQAAQLTTEAVTTAGGLEAGSGTEAFSWLRNLANKTGFSYMDASDQYNSFLSNSLGMGKSLSEGQQMFKGISEYSRVMHVTPAKQKLIFKAFTDMMGKGTIMSEELKKQLGNSLPGALSIFGEAYQTQIGGKLQGQDAVSALFAAMGKGKLKSSELLPIVTKLMEQKAAPTIEHASHTSQSEQDRFKNVQDDMVKIANESGVEEGFARIFRTLNAGLNESGGLVRTLSEGFNEATKEAERLLLFPQSFMRALEGKDSLVADWLGKDQTKQLQEDWKNIKQIFTDISSVKFDFLPTLEATAKEIAAIMGAIAEFQKWKQQASATTQEDAPDVGFWGNPITWGVQKGSKLKHEYDLFADESARRTQALSGDPTSPYYGNPGAYDRAHKDGFFYQTPEERETMRKEGMAAGTPDAGSTYSSTNTLDITVKIDPTTLASEDASKLAKYVGDAVKDHVGNMFGAVQDKFPVK